MKSDIAVRTKHSDRLRVTNEYCAVDVESARYKSTVPQASGSVENCSEKNVDGVALCKKTY